MDIIWLTVLYVSLGVVLYVYLGYPMVLWLLTILLPGKKVEKSDIRPKVTLIISCYNEESVIALKIDNTLAIDYPKELLEILVVSDGSTDETDNIVSRYEEKGIRLIRQEGRLGKTMGLNLAMSHTSGDIVVFSDANALYEKSAIQKLVNNFADPAVGYVVGEAQYNVDVEQSAATKNESSYWAYEIFIKKLESKLHSVVGGDGAIYAIRKELYKPLESTDINDFVNPLQIIVSGFRGVYEPDAIASEDAAGSYKKEFMRKTRIVNRSFSGLMKVKDVLNPFVTGFFSFEIISHKLLRWLVPFFIVLGVVAAVFLNLEGYLFGMWLLTGLGIFVFISLVGWGCHEFKVKLSNFFYLPYYFSVVNVAAFVGVLRSLGGDIPVAWETIRGETQQDRFRNKTIHWLLFGLVVFVVLCLVTIWLDRGGIAAVTFLFWMFSFIVCYVYVGYPVILFFWSRFQGNRVSRKEIFPTVSLLICAYNEENVIKAKIDNSLSLDYPHKKLQIILVSDGSTDSTNDIIRSYDDPRIEFYCYKERSGKIGAMLRTIPKITTDVVVFSDANAMYEKDSVRQMVSNFVDPEVGCVSGEVILLNETTSFAPSEDKYYSYERSIQKWESEIGSMIGADGAMYAIRRELFIAPVRDTILDDLVISMNIALQGYRIVYEDRAKAYEKNAVSHDAEFIRKSRIVAGAVQSIKSLQGVPAFNQPALLFCYVSHKVLRWMVPIFLIILFAANCLLCFQLSGMYYVFLGGQILFYVLALAGCTYRHNKLGKILSIPFYFCLVNLAALYGLYKGIFNKQKVRWEVFR